MPLPGARYRVVKRGGEKIRLAFRGKKTVIEAKNLRTGAMHSEKDFEHDRLKKRMMKKHG